MRCDGRWGRVDLSEWDKGLLGANGGHLLSPFLFSDTGFVSYFGGFLFFVFNQDMDRLMLTFGDIPHHAPVLLAWALLRHTLHPEETSSVVRKIGGTAIQLNVFQYLTRLLRSLASGGNDVRLGLLVLEHERAGEQGRSP